MKSHYRCDQFSSTMWYIRRSWELLDIPQPHLSILFFSNTITSHSHIKILHEIRMVLKTIMWGHIDFSLASFFILVKKIAILISSAQTMYLSFFRIDWWSVTVNDTSNVRLSLRELVSGFGKTHAVSKVIKGLHFSVGLIIFFRCNSCLLGTILY